MLTEIRLENFRCFENAAVRLGRLTAIVGPNASGKSSLLRALTVAQNRIEWHDHWRHDATRQVAVQFTYQEGGRYVAIDRPNVGPIAEGRGVAAQLLHLDIARLRDRNRTQSQELLDTHGGNLTNVFASVSRRDQELLARQLAALVPAIADVNAQPDENVGHLVLRFQDRWNPSVWYEATEVSDGTMLLTAYLVMQYQNSPIDLIAVEEPERGLHPFLLGELVSFWRGMSTGKIGPRPIQVVLATHSAELLEHLKPEEVRFLMRDPSSGAVRVDEVPAESEDWRTAYKTYQGSLGSMWLSGGLGGVPGR